LEKSHARIGKQRRLELRAAGAGEMKKGLRRGRPGDPGCAERQNGQHPIA
jgi:hypothetical protein